MQIEKKRVKEIPGNIEDPSLAPKIEEPAGPERIAEADKSEKVFKEISVGAGSAESIAPGLAAPAGDWRRERQRRVESILEKNLDNLYLALAPDKRQAFKDKGEETAAKIADLLEKGKAKARDIIVLIIKWLSLLPGVNKFFIEQEARIKADDIINNYFNNKKT